MLDTLRNNVEIIYLVYLIVCIPAWVVSVRVLAHWTIDLQQGRRPLESADYAGIGVAGLLIAAMWPIFASGLIILFVLQHLTRAVTRA